MSEYYFLWMSSEEAKNALLPFVLGLLSVQIVGYYLIGKIIPPDWQARARVFYQVLVIVFDLAAGLLVWGKIQ